MLLAVEIVHYAGVSEDDFGKWGGLAAFSALLFGSFIADNRKHFRAWRFWTLAILLLSAHLAVFAAVLIRVTNWKIIWFLVMMFEVPPLNYITNYFNVSRERKIRS